MRIHGALRLVAATAFALALTAAPAVARQSSDDQRVKPESKATREPVVRSPAAERSPTIDRPQTPPTIQRDFPRNDPANGLRQPNRDAHFERPVMRNRDRFPERQEIRRDAPMSSTRGREAVSVPANSLREAVVSADKDAVVLRLDGFSPAERARILLELQELLSRQQLEANKETAAQDEEKAIVPPSDRPGSPHVPNRERGRLVPPSEDPDDDDSGSVVTTPPVTGGGNTVVLGWGMWDWWYRHRMARFCASEARWYDLSPADRWELSRSFFNSWSPLWGFGFGPSWVFADAIGCPDRESFGYLMTWDDYVRRLEAKKDPRDEVVSCARVTVHRFDGGAASFEIEMPALGTETLNELHEVISKRLDDGKAVELSVVLRPGEVEKFSVDFCKSGN